MTWNTKANLRGPAGYNATGAAEDAAALAAFAAETAGPNAFGTLLKTDYATKASVAALPVPPDIAAWRKDYYDRAFALAPTVDRPAISYVQSATSTIASPGALIAPKREGDVTTNPADTVNDIHFRYDGSPTFPVVSASTGYVLSALIPGGASQNAYYTGRYEFVTEPTSTVVELKVRPPATSLVFHITVNGRPIAADANRSITGLTAGSSTLIKLTFPSAASRHIVFEPFGNTGFGGVFLPTGQTINKPTGTIALQQVHLGDSFLGGTGSPPTGAGRLETWGRQLAQLCRADSIYTQGIGGTGWTTANPYSDRVPDILTIAPDEVFIMGSRNDGNVDVSAQANAVLSSLASVPRVYLIGPTENPSYSTLKASLQTAATAAGRVYIDADDWFTGQTAKYIQTADNIHPTLAGQKRIACGIYEARQASLSI